jgi:hypothetical protein
MHLTTNPTTPDWAQRLLQEIYLLELEAGNIIKSESKEQWSTMQGDQLVSMAKRLDEGKSLRDDHTDTIENNLKRITVKLHAEGFTLSDIATMINRGIPTGSRLQYCDAEELSQYL